MGCFLHPKRTDHGWDLMEFPDDRCEVFLIVPTIVRGGAQRPIAKDEPKLPSIYSRPDPAPLQRRYPEPPEFRAGEAGAAPSRH